MVLRKGSQAGDMYLKLTECCSYLLLLYKPPRNLAAENNNSHVLLSLPVLKVDRAVQGLL